MTLHIITWLVSLGLHGAFVLGMLLPASSHVAEDVALHEGTGTDIMVVEQGIALQGVAKLGEDLMSMEAVQAPPLMATAAQPFEQVEAVEEQEELPVEEVSEIEPVEDQVIASEAGPENELVEPVQEEMTEPEPEVKEQPLPPQIATVPQETVLAMRESSGEEQLGGRTTTHMKYRGALRSHLEPHKVITRTKSTGTVLLAFTVKADGELVDVSILKSSGSEVLDDAARESISRAAPFPPIPSELDQDTYKIKVPFTYKLRR